jgi:hypothetical protein
MQLGWSVTLNAPHPDVWTDYADLDRYAGRTQVASRNVVKERILVCTIIAA